MIHIPSTSLFLHIPRTSGMSIVQTCLGHHCRHNLEDAAPNVVTGWVNSSIHRHATAYAAKTMFSDFDAVEKFAIIRSPWRMVESMFRWFVGRADAMDNGLSRHAGTPFHETCRRYRDMGFTRFVVDHFTYLNEGGFWKHWCSDHRTGALYDVEPIRFEDLDDPEVWNRVLRLLRIQGDAPRPKPNAAVSCVECVWSYETIHFINDRCDDDFDRFCYSRSPN